jgi:hypothetical protein
LKCVRHRLIREAAEESIQARRPLCFCGEPQNAELEAMTTISPEVSGRPTSVPEKRGATIDASDGSDPSDIVWGGENIAKVIDRSTRATFHMLEQGHLPARKVGRLWSASRRRLLAHLAGE